MARVIRNSMRRDRPRLGCNYVKAHKHDGGGIETARERTIGKLKDANTTNIPTATDAHGSSIDFKVTPGNVHDVTVAIHLSNISESANFFFDYEA